MFCSQLPHSWDQQTDCSGLTSKGVLLSVIQQRGAPPGVKAVRSCSRSFRCLQWRVVKCHKVTRYPVGRPGFRLLTGEKNFAIFFSKFQTGSATNPASCTMENGCTFPMGGGIKRSKPEDKHSPPSRAEIKKGGAIPLPLHVLMAWTGKIPLPPKVKQSHNRPVMGLLYLTHFC
jgi:hypothetical protein